MGWSMTLITGRLQAIKVIDHPIDIYSIYQWDGL